MAPAVLFSDSFNRVDPSMIAPGDNALGGGGAHFYIDIFPGGGARIDSNTLTKGDGGATLDFGGVQFASSPGSSGMNIGQNLNIKADLLVPKTSTGQATQAGLYFRSRAAAPDRKSVV